MKNEWLNLDSETDFLNYLEKEIKELKMPSPSNTVEIEGIIFRTFPFIEEKVWTKDLVNNFAKEDLLEKDFAIQHLYKNSLEKQLLMNSNFCIKIFKNIRKPVKDWFEKIIVELKDPDTDEAKRNLTYLIFEVSYFFKLIFSGFSVDAIKKKLKSYSKSNNSMLGITEGDTPIILNLLEENAIKNKLHKIDRVVSSSVKIYHNYLNIHIQLYGLDAEQILKGSKKRKRIPRDKESKILSYCVKGREENMEACIEFLTVYEEHREYINTNNTMSGKVRFVKKLLGNKVELPSQKTLGKYIDEYETNYREENQ